MSETATYPTVTPYLLYEDVSAALDWLGRAFGFTERLRFTDDSGVVTHAEMDTERAGLIMLGHPGADYRNPKHLGAASVLVHVYVEDVTAHHDRALAAGATILRGVQDEAYGDRRYDCEDLEGHRWSFAQLIADIPAQEWGATPA